jgi:membrane protein
LFKQAVVAWRSDYASSMGGALAYYTLFSIAPVLIIAIAVAGAVFGEEAARGEIIAQLRGLLGEAGATAVEGLLESARKPTDGVVATLISVVLLFVGATTVFAELQSDLDRIWKVPPQPGGMVWGLVRARMVALSLILVLGFLLLVSLVVSAGLAALGTWYGAWFEGWAALLETLNFVFAFVTTTALFAVIYKVLPRTRIAWHDVWIGAAVTSLLFAVGKLLIGLYIGTSGIASGFGAAGSFVVLLVWVYYSTQIFLLGAEFTRVYATARGSRRAGRKSIDAEAGGEVESLPHAPGH